MPAKLQPLYAVADSVETGELRLGLAGRGELRWAAVDLTAPLEQARLRLDLSPLSAVALGRAMAAAALLLRFSTKRPGRLRLEVLGDGPLGRVVVEIDGDGYLRGTVDEPHMADEEGSLSLAPAVGDGLLRVTQESPGRAPWTSQVELISGEIGKDLVHFLHQSQQVRSAALLGVLPVPEGIAAAGGLLVEALPGADDERVARLERAVLDLGGEVSAHLRAGGVAALCDAVLDGFDVEELERHGVVYRCRCSRDALLERLLTLPREDLEEAAAADGTCELLCAFCNGSFVFSMDELFVDEIN